MPAICITLSVAVNSLGIPVSVFAVKVAEGNLLVSRAPWARSSRRDSLLFSVLRPTVNVVGLAGSSPEALKLNWPFTSFVVPLATDEVGRLASFSGARYQASD